LNSDDTARHARIDVEQPFVFDRRDELAKPVVELHQQKSRERQAGIQQPLKSLDGNEGDA
jgi:hypothetical protein